MHGGPHDTEGVDELFYNDRLSADYVSVADYPARVDQAASDLLADVTIGESSHRPEHGVSIPKGGIITEFDFDRATGGYYTEGLREIAGERSPIHDNLTEYTDTEVGELAFRLNEVRSELSNNSSIDDLDRVIEAIIKKVRTRSIRRANVGVVGENLESPETVSDAIQQLLSDPTLSAYTNELIEIVNDESGGQSLIQLLDAPEMVTPLWDHQRKALQNWAEAERRGYVDMATATGKTVLGLAAIALQFGALHPIDEDETEMSTNRTPPSDEARVLIVAGQELILEQWRSEFDEHFDIPRDRTKTTTHDGRQRIRLKWGTIEFVTAQALFSEEVFPQYDLVILDEAHQYSRGSQSGRGWATVFEDLDESAESILAMSGSVDHGWSGDDAVKRILEERLTKCLEFSVEEARERGVVADFSWEVQYVCAAASDTQSSLIEETETIAAAYSDDKYQFDLCKLETYPPDGSVTREKFATLDNLRSFGQTSKGRELQRRWPAFDELMTAVLARRPHRWNLSPADSTVAEIVLDYLPENDIVVLVRSYKEAESIAEEITARTEGDIVTVPDSDGTAQFHTVTEFNESRYKVIVGPGDVLGTGVDMPEADVAVNLSKGGVNASLIQRIGRILRNPDGQKDAHFCHLVTTPSDENAYLYGEDGARVLTRAAQFRALGTRLRELPNYDARNHDTSTHLQALETAGAEAIRSSGRDVADIADDKVASDRLQDLLELIDESPRVSDEVTLVAEWDSETVERTIAPVQSSAKDEAPHTEKSGSGDRDKDNNGEGSQKERPDVTTSNSRENSTEASENESMKQSMDDAHGSVGGSSPDESEGDGYASGGDTLFGTPDGETVSSPTAPDQEEETGDSSGGRASTSVDDQSDGADERIQADQPRADDPVSEEDDEPVSEGGDTTEGTTKDPAKLSNTQPTSDSDSAINGDVHTDGSNPLSIEGRNSPDRTESGSDTEQQETPLANGTDSTDDDSPTHSAETDRAPSVDQKSDVDPTADDEAGTNGKTDSSADQSNAEATNSGRAEKAESEPTLESNPDTDDGSRSRGKGSQTTHGQKPVNGKDDSAGTVSELLSRISGVIQSILGRK